MLEIGLFNNFYSQGRIALLFDGFDEISPDYIEKVIELLQVLKNSKVEKLWITTRPYNFIQETLKDQLSVFSYSLKPLLLEEQKGFLRKFWKAKLKLNELDEQRSGVFIDELLDRLPGSIGGKDFMSIPLHAFMVAKVFKDMFKRFYDSNERELSDEHKKEIKKQNLVTLYERFIKIKFHEIRFGEKKPGMNIDDPDMKGLIKNKYKEFIEDHMKLALYAIFKKDKVEELLSQGEIEKITKLIEKIKQGEERTGLIEQVIDKNPRFVHRTFAEYFVASYFWESFKSVQFDKFEDFVENIIIKNLVKDDRMQISEFLQLKAKKDLESNIDFPDRQDKLRTLFTKLLDQTKKYGPGGDNKQSTKLLFGIIEFSFSTKEEGNIDVIERNDQLKLLCVSAEMGYIKLVNALSEKLDKLFVSNYLEYDKWWFSPLWLAARRDHLYVVQILVEKLSYDTNWEDKDGKTLVQRIFERGDYGVLRSCLRLDIVDVSTTYQGLNGEQESPLVHCLRVSAPQDVIKLLIEKTDINFINEFKSSGMKAAYPISVSLLKYDKEITELAIKKGIDFSQVINLLLYEFNYESLNSPIHPLVYSLVYKPSFHSDQEFLDLFERIELLLKAGVGYNYKDTEYKKTTLQYAEQIHYIHKLLDGVHKLHSQKNDKSSNPVDTILKLIIDSMSRSSDFRGYKIIIYPEKICLRPIYGDKSLEFGRNNEEISLLPDQLFHRGIAKLLFKFYHDNNTDLVKILGELSSYISNAKEEIEEFKKYPDSKILGIFEADEEMLKYKTFTNIEEKERQYKSLNESVKDLLYRVLDLYIKQDYEIDNALEEVSEKVSKFAKVISNTNSHYT